MPSACRTMGSMVAILLLGLPLSTDAGPIPLEKLEGVVTRIDEAKKSIAFKRGTYGSKGFVEVDDILFVDGATKVTIDGLPARFSSVSKGAKVTFTLVPRNPVALSVVLVTPEYEKRVAASMAYYEREMRKIEIAQRDAWYAKLALENAARRAILERELRAAMLQAQESQAQASLRAQDLVARHYQGRAPTTATGSNSETLRAFGFLAAGFGFHLFIKEPGATDFRSGIFRGLRDKAWEAFLKEAYPQLSDRQRGAMIDAVSLALDKQLSIDTFAAAQFKREAMDRLKDAFPNDPLAVEILDLFISARGGM